MTTIVVTSVIVLTVSVAVAGLAISLMALMSSVGAVMLLPGLVDRGDVGRGALLELLDARVATESHEAIAVDLVDGASPRVESFASELQQAKSQGEALGVDLANARELETTLRDDIFEASNREEELKRQISERQEELELVGWTWRALLRWVQQTRLLRLKDC